ncbi:hypothetical protein Ahy_B09g095892 [Arachis hypogaea]|uniref:Ubiquitin-like protease family profile domain-containing protein n=1 Tax=Arachis hypogaea TaxID=3818 RepID=A0A444XH19_ARAHY|nr:hypothetical protein Ahy_B09g095892 [Arachis hypogaea]
MAHVKHTKEGSNEYEPVFVLKHEGLYEGLREYFMSLMPKEHVHAVVVSIHNIILNEIKTKQYQEQIYIVPLDIVNFMLGTHDMKYTDKTINKAYRFDIEQYAHHRQFLDKRKLALYPFLFVPICNGGHWWLWIADVNKKKFYILGPINKKPEDIPDSRKELNKFVVSYFLVNYSNYSVHERSLVDCCWFCLFTFLSLSEFNNFPDEGVRWGGTLNGGWTGRGSRVYPIEWSTYRVRIFLFYSAIFNVFYFLYY